MASVMVTLDILPLQFADDCKVMVMAAAESTGWKPETFVQILLRVVIGAEGSENIFSYFLYYDFQLQLNAIECPLM